MSPLLRLDSQFLLNSSRLCRLQLFPSLGFDDHHLVDDVLVVALIEGPVQVSGVLVGDFEWTRGSDQRRSDKLTTRGLSESSVTTTTPSHLSPRDFRCSQPSHFLIWCPHPSVAPSLRMKGPLFPDEVDVMSNLSRSSLCFNTM